MKFCPSSAKILTSSTVFSSVEVSLLSNMKQTNCRRHIFDVFCRNVICCNGVVLSDLCLLLNEAFIKSHLFHLDLLPSTIYKLLTI